MRATSSNPMRSKSEVASVANAGHRRVIQSVVAALGMQSDAYALCCDAFKARRQVKLTPSPPGCRRRNIKASRSEEWHRAWRHSLSLTAENDLPALTDANDRDKEKVRKRVPSNVYSMLLAGARMPLHTVILLLAACEHSVCVGDQQYMMYKMVSDNKLEKCLAWLGYWTRSKSSIAAFSVRFQKFTYD